MTYGLPRGTNITYGSKGFPQWVYDLGNAFGLKASTYPGHQESNRNDAGFAPNPQGLNRGIDWTGPVDRMQRFADYCLTVKGSLEQVIWQNPHTGQKVGVAGGKDVTHTAYYGADYGGHRDHVHTRQSNPIPLQGNPVPDNRPDFNEYPIWSPNTSSRNGRKPDLFLLHTQEGGGGNDAADNLARWYSNPATKVSYHYAISQASDGGVTVVDTADTDRASWSVLSANSRSINLVFAGSRAAWTREQWLKQAKAIDVAAYLAVQDCRKYGIPVVVNPPPYKQQAGISDHGYVTKVLKDGDHTDVGPNFPWDVFSQAVDKYATGKTAPPPPPQPGFKYPPTEEMIKQIWEQLFGPKAQGWAQLFGKTDDGKRGKFLAEAVADLHKDVP